MWHLGTWVMVALVWGNGWAWSLGGISQPKQVPGAMIEKGVQEHSHSSPAGRSRYPRETCFLQQQDPTHKLTLGCAAPLSLPLFYRDSLQHHTDSVRAPSPGALPCSEPGSPRLGSAHQGQQQPAQQPPRHTSCPQP